MPSPSTMLRVHSPQLVGELLDEEGISSGEAIGGECGLQALGVDADSDIESKVWPVAQAPEDILGRGRAPDKAALGLVRVAVQVVLKGALVEALRRWCCVSGDGGFRSRRRWGSLCENWLETGFWLACNRLLLPGVAPQL